MCKCSEELELAAQRWAKRKVLAIFNDQIAHMQGLPDELYDQGLVRKFIEMRDAFVIDEDL